MNKRKSRVIQLGSINIGGENPPVIQTMITTPLCNIDQAVSEAAQVSQMGCHLIRTAFKSEDEAPFLKQFVNRFDGEVIADIHFNYKLAILALSCGVKGIRFNPGNIGGMERVKEIIAEVKKHKDVAVRIGVNSGSLEKEIVAKYGGVTTDGIIESTLHWASFLENNLDFHNFKISAKSHNVTDTVVACKHIAKLSQAPFHVGITEAGGGLQGRIKSAIGIGTLIEEGLANTFRVSLTAPITDEIKTGMYILKACGVLQSGGEIVSCPTCGRTHGALFSYYEKLEKFFDDQKWWMKPRLTVALMGCEVNGPGEAKEADMGIALGSDSALFFKNGVIDQKFNSQNRAFKYLLMQIELFWNSSP